MSRNLWFLLLIVMEGFVVIVVIVVIVIVVVIIIVVDICYLYKFLLIHLFIYWLIYLLGR